jgi:hypothetical protein
MIGKSKTAKFLVTKLQLPLRDWEAGASQWGFPSQSLGTSFPVAGRALRQKESEGIQVSRLILGELS